MFKLSSLGEQSYFVLLLEVYPSRGSGRECKGHNNTSISLRQEGGDENDRSLQFQLELLQQVPFPSACANTAWCGHETNTASSIRAHGRANLVHLQLAESKLPGPSGGGWVLFWETGGDFWRRSRLDNLLLRAPHPTHASVANIGV